MKPSLVLGIDPGFSGALALLAPGSFLAPYGELMGVWDMPTSQTKSGKNQVDAIALSTLLSVYADDIKFAVVEDVGAMVYTNARGETRGQGAAASFAFGKAAGVLDGVLSALRIPIIPVKPSVWKMLMGVSADKNTSRAKASELFPSHAQMWSRKMDDGRAEAALLAYFGANRVK